jgi:hypothetical protein
MMKTTMTLIAMLVGSALLPACSDTGRDSGEPAAVAARLAQDGSAGVTRYLVITDRVKPEKTSEWLALQKDEVLPALKKAGVRERKIYHTVLGDTTEFVTYLPFPDYGEMDGPDALDRALGKATAADLKERLGNCLLSSYSRLERSQNEFFIDPGDAPALFSSAYRAAPGRSGDYLVFLREHMQPPMQRAVESGFIEGYQVMLTDQGGEVGIYVLNMFYPDFDTLDQGPPAAKMMGAEERAEFFRAGAGLIAPLGQYIYRYEADLSFSFDAGGER